MTLCFSLFILFLFACTEISLGETPVLFDASMTQLEQLTTQDSKIILDGGKLAIHGGTQNMWPGVRMQGKWDARAVQKLIY